MSLAAEQRQFMAELFGAELFGEHEGERSALAEFYRQQASSRLREILEPIYGEVLAAHEFEPYFRFLEEDPPRSMDPIESVSRFLAWFATSKSMDIDDCLLERMSVLCCEYCVENAPDAGWQALEASELSANSLHDVEVDLAPWVAKLGVLAPVPAREQVDRWCTRDVDGFACWPETSPAAARLLARLYGLGGLRLEPKAPALCELAEHRFLGHRSLGQGSRLLLSDHEEGPVTE